MTVAAYVPDLMDRSRIGAAGASVTWVSTPAELIGTVADLVIVDLSRPGVLEFIPRINRRVVGFASHVDRELMAAARDAGCDEVLARSAFFSRLPEIVGGAG